MVTCARCGITRAQGAPEAKARSLEARLSHQSQSPARQPPSSGRWLVTVFEPEEMSGAWLHIETQRRRDRHQEGGHWRARSWVEIETVLAELETLFAPFTDHLIHRGASLEIGAEVEDIRFTTDRSSLQPLPATVVEAVRIQVCDHPGCEVEIPRGARLACGEVHGAGDPQEGPGECCRGYFCPSHLYCGPNLRFALCESCDRRSTRWRF